MKEMVAKRMAASSFKARCLKLLDDVHEQRVVILITKRGKPVARLVPVDDDERTARVFGAGRGSCEIVGDIVAPAVPPEHWRALGR
ncbi:MAG: type II toxin-antitoxin system Phd/YefM family antitoxin [Deltaproteobacteria bacterium]|nr:type II toxin-antitoxin system Phd/YefM family antitoxin [Deltaproteobacteria bacterium]